MSLKVTLVELTVYERLLPLVSGYLEACCRDDESLRGELLFETYSAPVKTPAERLLFDLVKSRADVYGFSCYVWNTGRVRQLLPGLRAALPHARLVLGGPQVIHQAARYASPQDELTAVCNGEGEFVFRNYMRELVGGAPDLARVRGLSFHRDAQLVTTPDDDKIMDLDRIPSPFLGGLFEKDRYTYAIFETNRGCPYRCSFCYWGLGESRVGKFSDERVRAELTWLSRNGFMGIFLADANWGMLKRDVDFSRHIVENKRATGMPYVVVVSSAKNKPERLVEIAEIFQGAGIMTTQSVAVQSLDEETLRRVERSNIKVDAYAEAQQRMNERRLASYVELIWPLPGETLASFTRGVERLCAMHAQAFIPYPLQLLNNTKLRDRREEFGFVTLPESDESGGEAELVVATREVSSREYEDGLWFCFALLALYNARGAYCLAHHLQRRGARGYGALFGDFAAFCRARPAHPLVDDYARSLRERTFAEAAHWGRVLHHCLHGLRAEFDALLRDFVESQPWWDEAAQAVFEVDQVNKLYAYSNTPLNLGAQAFRRLRVTPLARGAEVSLRPEDLALVRDLIEMLEPGPADAFDFTVSYKRRQMPYMKAQSLDHNASYCHAVMENIRSFMPVWTARAPARPAADAGDARLAGASAPR